MISRKAAIAFFERFAIFECAMKETGTTRFLQEYGGRATPAWRALASWVGPLLEGSNKPEILEAVTYLNEQPPMVQRVVDGCACYSDEPLTWDGRGARAVEATTRVRNNLFHGGKSRPSDEQARDEMLVRHAGLLIDECLSLSPDLQAAQQKCGFLTEVKIGRKSLTVSSK